nr:MAG TPA: hypothetical protein [Bacteriophage sp.]
MQIPGTPNPQRRRGNPLNGTRSATSSAAFFSR